MPCPTLSEVEVLVVQCGVCHTAGVVDTPAEASPQADREAWASTPCFFVPGCLGHVWPEAIN